MEFTTMFSQNGKVSNNFKYESKISGNNSWGLINKTCKAKLILDKEKTLQ